MGSVEAKMSPVLWDAKMCFFLNLKKKELLFFFTLSSSLNLESFSEYSTTTPYMVATFLLSCF